MDHLAFGLLVGSLIVIASFVIRDGLPNLSGISESSRLSRLSRAKTPLAWAHWCADVGLVLAAAGTVILVVTGATLLADLSDGTGNVVVGLGVAGAVLASILGIARLTQRLGGEDAAERAGELPAVGELGVLAVSLERRPHAEPTVAATVAPYEPDDHDTSSDRTDVWADELPTWAAARPRDATPAVFGDLAVSTSDLAASSGDAATSDDAAIEQGRVEWVAAAAIPVTESAPKTLGGVFSSPLLADIGPSPVMNHDEDGFTSPLLSDLGRDDPDAEIDPANQSDLLIDEAPAPVQSGGRQRDEIVGR